MKASPLNTRLGGLYRKYRIDLAGKRYSEYADTVIEARDIAIAGVIRLGVRAAYISRISPETRKDFIGLRAPNYDDYERYFMKDGKLVVKKGRFEE